MYFELHITKWIRSAITNKDTGKCKCQEIKWYTMTNFHDQFVDYLETDLPNIMKYS